MCGRVFSTLRRVDMARIARTRNVNARRMDSGSSRGHSSGTRSGGRSDRNDTISEDNDGYTRHYNIGPRSFLSCIMHSSSQVYYKQSSIDKKLESRSD
jgi:hypothetical protein